MRTVRTNLPMNVPAIDALRDFLAEIDRLSLYSSYTGTPPDVDAGEVVNALFGGYAPITVTPTVSQVGATGVFTLALAGPFSWVPTGDSSAPQIVGVQLNKDGVNTHCILFPFLTGFKMTTANTFLRVQNIALSINPFARQWSGSLQFEGIGNP